MLLAMVEVALSDRRLQPQAACVTASARGRSLCSRGTPRATLRPQLKRVSLDASLKKDGTLRYDQAIAARLEELTQRYYGLMNSDPLAAADAVRCLAEDPVLGEFFTQGFRGGVLVDAGIEAGSPDIIAEGVDILERLEDDEARRPNLACSLANGLSGLANLDETPAPDWYLSTGPSRFRARRLYKDAILSNLDSGLTARACCGLGNALWRSHRWVEAYDCYQAALANDPTNGVASTGAVRVLIRCLERGVGSRDVLLSAAARNLALAREHSRKLEDLAGPAAVKYLESLSLPQPSAGVEIDPDKLTDYQRFVLDRRLVLSPTIEGLDADARLWDRLRIRHIIEPIGENGRVPPMFAMFNTLKSDFLLARYLAFAAETHAVQESGVYHDTLDYARYGVSVSLLTGALRVCMDLLDKMAVAVSDYLGIPGRSQKIYFRTRWFQKREPHEVPAWQPPIDAVIRSGNYAVIALAEVSSDLGKYGYLKPKSAWRNTATHRFAVLHDPLMGDFRRSTYVDHCMLRDFQRELSEGLQLARSALLYFVEMIAIEEAKKARQLRTGLLYVPDHHEMRGGS